MKTGRDRYFQDAHFKALVDLMVVHIHRYDYTPSEMRDAAMVASMIAEDTTIRPLTLSSELDRLRQVFPELK